MTETLPGTSDKNLEELESENGEETTTEDYHGTGTPPPTHQQKHRRPLRDYHGTGTPPPSPTSDPVPAE